MVRIFRGGRLGDLEPELQSGVARGRPITVHHADLDSIRERVEAVGEDYNAIRYQFDRANRVAADARIDTMDRLDRLGVLEGTETKYIAGGFSKSYLTSLGFAKSAVLTVADVPIVLVLDTDAMAHEPVAVEYKWSFALDRPHVAGYVDRGASMLRAANGDVIYASVKTGETSVYSEGEVLWTQNPLDRLTDLGREQEVAFEGGTVPITDGATDAIATLNTSDVDRLLESAGAVDDEDAAETLSNRERHEAVHRIISAGMPALADRLTVLELIVMPEIYGNDSTDPGKFVHAYDGTRHYTDTANVNVLSFG